MALDVLLLMRLHLSFFYVNSFNYILEFQAAQTVNMMLMLGLNLQTQFFMFLFSDVLYTNNREAATVLVQNFERLQALYIISFFPGCEVITDHFKNNPCMVSLIREIALDACF